MVYLERDRNQRLIERVRELLNSKQIPFRELDVSGDAQEVMCYSPGIQFTKLEAKDNAVTATAKIAPDCRLGEHAFRLRCGSGVSELKTVWVGAMPVVAEKEPNNEFANPQTIPLNCTVQGTITSEDVDYFAVEAKKGQRISVEIEGVRVLAQFVGLFRTPCPSK